MPGTVKSELLPDADRLHKCDGQEKVCEIQHLPLDKSHFITVNGNLQNEKSRILIEDEISDLLEGDIPYFYFRCDERSLFTWDNKEEKGFFKSSALEQIQENIRNMSITDLREQIQYIKITFNMENAANIKIENKNLGTISGVNKLGIAEKMIKKLVHKIGAETIYSDDGTDVNWIGVKLCV